MAWPQSVCRPVIILLLPSFPFPEPGGGVYPGKDMGPEAWTQACRGLRCCLMPHGHEKVSGIQDFWALPTSAAEWQLATRGTRGWARQVRNAEGTKDQGKSRDREGRDLERAWLADPGERRVERGQD